MVRRAGAFSVMTMVLGKAIRNGVQGIGDLAEARRVIIAHAEHEAKERALAQFRLFRPPNMEVIKAHGVGGRGDGRFSRCS